MSTLKHNLLEYANVALKTKGTSNTGNLQKAFPNAPQYNDYKDAAAFELYESLLNADSVTYNGVANFSMNYNNGAPDFNDVEVGGSGLPSTPFTPNVASPGVGSTSAVTQPEFTGDTKNLETINNFGTGLGGLISPAETTPNIANTKIGQYISGKSFAGSDGK